MGERGLTLLLEPINTRDVPGYVVHRSAQALAILEAIGVGNTRLQYDCFHMQVMEGNLAETLERQLPRIGSHPDRRQSGPRCARQRRDPLPVPVPLARPHRLPRLGQCRVPARHRHPCLAGLAGTLISETAS
jgi:hypothetical protein